MGSTCHWCAAGRFCSCEMQCGSCYLSRVGEGGGHARTNRHPVWCARDAVVPVASVRWFLKRYSGSVCGNSAACAPSRAKPALVACLPSLTSRAMPLHVCSPVPHSTLAWRLRQKCVRSVRLALGDTLCAVVAMRHACVCSRSPTVAGGGGGGGGGAATGTQRVAGCGVRAQLLGPGCCRAWGVVVGGCPLGRSTLRSFCVGACMHRLFLISAGRGTVWSPVCAGVSMRRLFFMSADQGCLLLCDRSRCSTLELRVLLGPRCR